MATLPAPTRRSAISPGPARCLHSSTAARLHLAEMVHGGAERADLELCRRACLWDRPPRRRRQLVAPFPLPAVGTPRSWQPRPLADARSARSLSAGHAE